MRSLTRRGNHLLISKALEAGKVIRHHRLQPRGDSILAYTQLLSR